LRAGRKQRVVSGSGQAKADKGGQIETGQIVLSIPALRLIVMGRTLR
jgi:hypothetical protein